MRLRSTFSLVVAGYMRDGFSLSEALRRVIGHIHDGSGPRTSEVLADLEDMGVWKPNADS